MIERMRANGLREKVEEADVGDDGFAFPTRCRYPDGKEVGTSSFSRVRDGRIVRLVSVEGLGR